MQQKSLKTLYSVERPCWKKYSKHYMTLLNCSLKIKHWRPLHDKLYLLQRNMKFVKHSEYLYGFVDWNDTIQRSSSRDIWSGLPLNKFIWLTAWSSDRNKQNTKFLQTPPIWSVSYKSIARCHICSLFLVYCTVPCDWKVVYCNEQVMICGKVSVSLTLCM